MPYTDILGQENCLALLRRTLSKGKAAHAYLFEGIEGCGKKKTAIAFIEAVFCGRDEGCGQCPSCRRMAQLQHPDLHLIEPDGAFIKIDQIRELQKELSLRPYEAPRKACLIDGVDRLNPAAGNALLKTLEEPPGNALIILLTAHVGSVLPTILSRCQRLRFPALPQAAVEEFLRSRECAPETARIIASLAGGSLKRALEIGEDEALTDRTKLLERLDALTTREMAPLFSMAEELSGDREKALETLDLLATYLRDILLLQGGSSEVINADLLPLIEKNACRFSLDAVMERIRHVFEARYALQRNVNPRLALEVLFMRLAEQ
ncbi:MAG TPA: DNA polymerase III subunit delta' [Geobacteraceae bacterium]|nr:DNA polymerase III subunit delta' [Geobacteraceae bacterium]